MNINEPQDRFHAITAALRLAVPPLTLALLATFGAQSSAQQPATAGGARPSGAGTREITITGCVQKARGTPQNGAESPSGFILTNASTESYATPGAGAVISGPPGGGGGAQGAPASPPSVGGVGSSASRDRIEGGTDRGGSSGMGLTYVLEGSDIESHAGERVEVRGTLAPIGDSGKRGPEPSSAASPRALPQRLVVASMRTVTARCEQ